MLVVQTLENRVKSVIIINEDVLARMEIVVRNRNFARSRALTTNTGGRLARSYIKTPRGPIACLNIKNGEWCALLLLRVITDCRELVTYQLQ